MGGMKTFMLLAPLLGAVANSSRLDDKKVRSMSLMERKENFWRTNRKFTKFTKSHRGAQLDCDGGSVTVNGDVYECSEVDFLSLVGSEEMKIVRPDFPEDEINELADMWGWLSPSGREINIVCLSTGVRFVDSTDPLNPKMLGFMQSNRPESYWCDAKVYKDTVYIVKDRFRSQAVEPENGIHVFNLLQLEDNDGSEVVEYFPDSIYNKHGNSHNVVVNTETGFIYTVGNDGDACNAGLHAVDVSDPANPTFAGCAGQDGYVHDAQCVVYTGPDTRYTGRELCFGYNEDSLTIFDVEDKDNMFVISKVGYDTPFYTHQGWLINDMSHLLLDDELDELDGGLPRTRTFIFDVSDLQNPVLTGHYDHPADSIDHNLYIWGLMHARGDAGNPPMENPPSDQYAYHANYCSGLRVVDISGVKQVPPQLKEVGFFDVSPDCNTHDWYGSWSTYMHPSGVVAISGIEKGLFFVKPRMVFQDPNEQQSSAPTKSGTSAPAPTAAGEQPSGGLTQELTDQVMLIIVAALGVIALVLSAALLVVLQRKTPEESTPAETVVKAKAAPNSAEERKVANPAFVE